MQNKYTTVDVIRHGACEGGEMLRGVTDVPLSELGRQQMRDAIEAMPLDGETRWQRIISSPLVRCRAFADEQAQRFAIPVEEDERWREVDFGEWDGKLIEDLQRSDGENLRRYFVSPTSFTPPGGEAFAKVYDRISEAWLDTVQRYQHQHLLIVMHSLSIRLLLAHVLGTPLDSAARVDVPYASLTRFHVYHHGEKVYPMLIAHNNWGTLHG